MHLRIDRRLVLRWVRATWFGWLLGIPFIIVLALVGEAVGIGGAQVLVGAGLGTGIGLMQGRMIRSMLPKSGTWLWSCVVGLALPFLVTDIAKAARWDARYSLFVCVAVGGLISGAWQAIILRTRFRKTLLWVVASALGWTLAAGTSTVADPLSRLPALRGLWGAVVYLGIVAAGGLILGLVTAYASHGCSNMSMLSNDSINRAHQAACFSNLFVKSLLECCCPRLVNSSVRRSHHSPAIIIFQV